MPDRLASALQSTTALAKMALVVLAGGLLLASLGRLQPEVFALSAGLIGTSLASLWLLNGDRLRWAGKVLAGGLCLCYSMVSLIDSRWRQSALIGFPTAALLVWMHFDRRPALGITLLVGVALLWKPLADLAFHGITVWSGDFIAAGVGFVLVLDAVLLSIVAAEVITANKPADAAEPPANRHLKVVSDALIDTLRRRGLQSKHPELAIVDGRCVYASPSAVRLLRAGGLSAVLDLQFEHLHGRAVDKAVEAQFGAGLLGLVGAGTGLIVWEPGPSWRGFWAHVIVDGKGGQQVARVTLGALPLQRMPALQPEP